MNKMMTCEDASDGSLEEGERDARRDEEGVINWVGIYYARIV